MQHTYWTVSCNTQSIWMSLLAFNRQTKQHIRKMFKKNVCILSSKPIDISILANIFFSNSSVYVERRVFLSHQVYFCPLWPRLSMLHDIPTNMPWIRMPPSDPQKSYNLCIVKINHCFSTNKGTLKRRNRGGMIKWLTHTHTYIYSLMVRKMLLHQHDVVLHYVSVSWLNVALSAWRKNMCFACKTTS